MVVVRWYVQLTVIWHWYLPLCISRFLLIFLLLFLSFLFFFFFFKSGIDDLDRMPYVLF